MDPKEFKYVSVITFSSDYLLQCDFSLIFRDFNKTHGRAVMKEEDIHPVANEYQRYKVNILLRHENFRTDKIFFQKDSKQMFKMH